jgi:4-hydroxybenzoate polyprenyltransferase
MSKKSITTFVLFVKLIRLEQWVKNGFVFLPAFFNKNLFEQNSLLNGAWAFLTFSLMASAIYCFNDLVDVNLDKLHEHKRKRPYANGELSKKMVLRCVFGLSITSLVLSFLFVNSELLLVLLCYFILNLFYTKKLKNIVLLDIIIIAFSFVLRIIAGGVATAVELSYWIVLMVFLLAIFLALAKRRDELLLFLESGVRVRKNINQYHIKAVNIGLLGIATLIIGFYVAYTLSPKVMDHFQSKTIFTTSLFVFFGLVRYFLLLKKRVVYANPTKIILKDTIMQLIVLGWFFNFYILMYL